MIPMKRLRRFWFTFERIDSLTALNLGCGVTAYDYDDAITLLQERVFTDETIPKITGCIEDIDVSTLDHSHVLPNIGIVIARGIWFPQGYEQ